MDELRGLTLERIETEAQALEMAAIRNVCRDGFSSFREPIGHHQQRLWWAQNKEHGKAFLYRGPSGEVVGFGLLRPDRDEWITTVAVLPAFAGSGYGKAISRHLVRECPGPVRSTARRDNPAAVKLHDVLYWREVEGADPALVYFEARSATEREAIR